MWRYRRSVDVLDGLAEGRRLDLHLTSRSVRILAAVARDLVLDGQLRCAVGTHGIARAIEQTLIRSLLIEALPVDIHRISGREVAVERQVVGRNRESGARRVNVLSALLSGYGQRSTRLVSKAHRATVDRRGGTVVHGNGGLRRKLICEEPALRIGIAGDPPAEQRTRLIGVAAALSAAASSSV